MLKGKKVKVSGLQSASNDSVNSNLLLSRFDQIRNTLIFLKGVSCYIKRDVKV